MTLEQDFAQKQSPKQRAGPGWIREQSRQGKELLQLQGQSASENLREGECGQGQDGGAREVRQGGQQVQAERHLCLLSLSSNICLLPGVTNNSLHSEAH